MISILTQNGPNRLTSIVCLISSSVNVSRRYSWEIPALLTNTSTSPISRRTLSATDLTWSALLTSQTYEVAVPPCSWISLTTFSTLSCNVKFIHRWNILILITPPIKIYCQSYLYQRVCRLPVYKQSPRSTPGLSVGEYGLKVIDLLNTVESQWPRVTGSISLTSNQSQCVS